MKTNPIAKDPVQQLFEDAETVMRKLIHKDAMKFVADRRGIQESVKAGIKRRTVRVKSVLP